MQLARLFICRIEAAHEGCTRTGLLLIVCAA